MVRIKYIVDEKIRQHFNQRIVGVSNSITAIKMITPTKNIQKTTRSLLVRLNPCNYNKLLIELYCIGFLALTIGVNLASVVVKNNLRTVSAIYQYLPSLLRFLDLAPRVLLSVIFPLTTYAKNPKNRKYARTLIGEDRL